MTVHYLNLFDKDVSIDCDDQFLNSSIISCYSAFEVTEPRINPDLILKIRRRPQEGWVLTNHDSSVVCENLADIVFFLEKMLTIDLQKLRTDLFFLHAAVLSKNDRCTLIVGESGAGKSTLCLDLCAEKYAYMSDELAPVDPRTGQVYPYPHAICLKAEPDSSIVEAEKCLRTSRTIHIPVEDIPTAVRVHPAELQNIVFLVRTEVSWTASAIPIGCSEAATRLYANGLNQLAHTNQGLSAAVQLANRGNCFLLQRGTRQSNLVALKSIMEAQPRLA